jgi:hypothetical protein
MLVFSPIGEGILVYECSQVIWYIYNIVECVCVLVQAGDWNVHVCTQLLYYF